MSLRLLLISQNNELEKHLKNQLTKFNFKLVVSPGSADYLLDEVVGLIWDMKTVKLPSNES